MGSNRSDSHRSEVVCLRGINLDLLTMLFVLGKGCRKLLFFQERCISLASGESPAGRKEFKSWIRESFAIKTGGKIIRGRE